MFFSACQSSVNVQKNDTLIRQYSPGGVAPTPIVIQGPASKGRAEISGLAWYGDVLVLLPQYPSRFFGGPDGALITLKKGDILQYLDETNPSPLNPGYIPFAAPGIGKISGFEGFESIAIQDEKVYLTIETHVGLWEAMKGYLVQGEIFPDLTRVSVDINNKVELPPLSNIFNLSHEAVLIFDGEIITFYEGNGTHITTQPVAYRHNLTLQKLPSLSFPHIEYRITDVTSPDENGRFWALNVFQPGDRWLENDDDGLIGLFGEEFSHYHNEPVERIVEFQIYDDKIAFSGRDPIRLKLNNMDIARNWEGIARLDQRGFLLVTDKIPGTILGFIPQTEKIR